MPANVTSIASIESNAKVTTNEKIKGIDGEQQNTESEFKTALDQELEALNGQETSDSTLATIVGNTTEGQLITNEQTVGVVASVAGSVNKEETELAGNTKVNDENASKEINKLLAVVSGSEKLNQHFETKTKGNTPGETPPGLPATEDDGDPALGKLVNQTTINEKKPQPIPTSPFVAAEAKNIIVGEAKKDDRVITPIFDDPNTVVESEGKISDQNKLVQNKEAVKGVSENKTEIEAAKILANTTQTITNEQNKETKQPTTLDSLKASIPGQPQQNNLNNGQPAKGKNNTTSVNQSNAGINSAKTAEEPLFDQILQSQHETTDSHKEQNLFERHDKPTVDTRVQTAQSVDTKGMETIRAQNVATKSEVESVEQQLNQQQTLNRQNLTPGLQERVMMMSNQGINTAEIHLDPVNLGKLQIKLSQEGDQISVSFMVQNGQAKEMLESTMPKLRELLEEQGIELGEGEVHQQEAEQDQQQEWQQAQNFTNNQGISETLSEEDDTVTTIPISSRQNSGIDYFA